jgi:splicing factor 3A subunit 1
MELVTSSVDTGIGNRSVKVDGGREIALETHTQNVGVIVPPPDVRVIVDKTAQFVGKNGPEFEQRILASEKNNVKFNFLTTSDPYHAYYRQKVEEAKAQAAGTEPASAVVQAGPPVMTKASTGTAKPVVLEPPKNDEFTIPIPAGISALDLDVIKVTAQFAARNGKKFVTTLASKEHANPQFNFLRPQHSMFTFFTALADAYEKVLSPDDSTLVSLVEGCDKSVALQRVLTRLEWESAQDKARKDKEDAEEEERIQMALIDWHSFVVVETLDFNDTEDFDLPPPMKLNEVIEAMRKNELAAPVLPGGESGPSDSITHPVKATLDDEAKESINQTQQQIHSNPEPPVVEQVGSMKIVRNYKKPEERKVPTMDSTKFVVSPITGEMIPLDQMAEHMRISLIDPKWKVQKEAMMAKLRGSTQASHEDVAANVLNLARNRPDIFGSSDDEMSKAIDAELRKSRQVSIQGSGSMVPPPPPPPPPAVVPPPPPAAGTLNAGKVEPPQTEHRKRREPEHPHEQEEAEPEPKKLKVGEVELDEEFEFLAAHPGRATIKVVCPAVGGETGLNGQTLEVEVESLSDKIVDLKRAIKPLAGDLPQNKQKLSTPGLGFLKDTASLAYYNLRNGSAVTLSIKARGKR